MTLSGCVEQMESLERSGDKPTIVSLNPCTDAILAEVAEPEQLLAISHYSHDAKSSSMDVAKARQFAATGGTVEEVLALSPDIVVAGSFLPPSTRQAFSDLGIRVETFGIAATIDDSKAQIDQLAGLAGNPEKGSALVAAIDLALDQSKAGDADPLSAVLWQPSGIVPGEDALVSALMRHTGFASHSAARGMGQADYLSFERMLVDPPEVLLLAGQERSQQHPALEQIATHRATFDTSLLYCGGPTIIRAVERLRSIRERVS
ncbi:ABC transporter substrate-binding protein [Pontixanthobacter aquaemixtae]|uniref:ABC transporter substrate-binding protein n=1 Tax=Pontixanthobacter aquaemixtae TaxID=1958940 RepID=A0A844ZUZ4_9SPHN|nr:ABC transporter substrate-binding protein [Pontixanthobacter aquaemixtae]MXO90597.1 ABC transporter substrate-binding protein [Pontixanthobacter aquaemixtae]